MNFLRSFKYSDAKFYATLLQGINNEFINYVKERNMDLYNRLSEYAASESVALIDKACGIVDIGHLAATVEGYLFCVLVDSFWLGWGGDLASLMKEVDEEHNKEGGNYNTIAKKLLGKKSSFGYGDICTDADALKISSLVFNSTSNHAFSEAIDNYYTGWLPFRYSYYRNELGVERSESYAAAILQKMTEGFVNNIEVQILGGIPSNESKQACCEAFSDFIIEYEDFYHWYNTIIIA